MFNWIEILGVSVGLLYLWWEYKASIWLWLASIIMPAIYIFIYAESGFYADMGINIYYLIAGIYGWVVWFCKKGDKKCLLISHTPRKAILPMGGVFLALFFVIIYILHNFTDSTVVIGDSFTTALSVVALFMLSRKWVEQWLVWIVVDIVCVILYAHKGLYPTAILYALYSVIAVFGYLNWLKLMKNDKNS